VFKLQDSTINLFYNCEIITMNINSPTADAMAVFQDKIFSIGSENEVRDEISKFKTSSENKIKILENNMEGKCIVPGFIDAHMHPGYYIYYKTQLDLSKIRSYSELEIALKKDDSERDPDDWIFGMNLMEDIFDNPEERRFPNKKDLDQMCPQRPVAILRHDGHICTVNSKVLEIIGIDASNVKELTPKGGEIRIDENGNPTGIFTEDAKSLILDKVPINTKGLEKAAKDVCQELASFGITTCGAVIQAGEEGLYGKAGAMEMALFETLIKERLIEQDMVFYIITDKPRKLKRLNKAFQKLDKGENRFVLGGIKLFGDGSFGASTAYLFEPYYKDMNGNVGFMVRDQQTLFKLTKETYDLGFQITIHSIGDKSNRIVVDVYKEIINEIKKSENIKIEKSNKFGIVHASLLKEDILRDAAALGIIFICQPNFINSEYTWIENRLGPDRLKTVYPFRSIIDAGIIIAGSSDAPIESASVLDGFKACITRNGFIPEEVITPEETLKMYTINAAFAIGQDSIKGSLEKGKLADFIILNHNIIKIPPEKLYKIKILKTYHRGKLIFSEKR